MPAVFDAESLDLALSAFEKQAHRQQRLLGANKAKKNKDNQHQQQQQQQAEQGEGDSSNVSGGGVVAAECEETSGAGEGQEEKSVEDKGFLSRALESLASRGGRGSCGIDPRGLPADVTCLQRVLSPFILRRLKAEVMQELPRKTNIVLRCELEGSQKALYLKEVRHHESDLALSLRRLTHAFAANEEIPNNNAGAAANPKAEAHEKGPQPTEADPKEPGENGLRPRALRDTLTAVCGHKAGIRLGASQLCLFFVPLALSLPSLMDVAVLSPFLCRSAAPCRSLCLASSFSLSVSRFTSVCLSLSVCLCFAVSLSPSPVSVSLSPPRQLSLCGSPLCSEGGGKRFVSSLLFRLRRICNHALLMQGKYSSEQKDVRQQNYQRALPNAD